MVKSSPVLEKTASQKGSASNGGAFLSGGAGLAGGDKPPPLRMDLYLKVEPPQLGSDHGECLTIKDLC
jgi:hypothetical protein